MEQTIKSPATRHRSAERGPRDAFVMIAMTLVVVAFGLALYIQLGLSLWLAVLLSLTAFASMMSVHALVRRGQTVASLEAEVRELRQQLEKHGVGAETASGRDLPAASASAPAAAAPVAPSPRLPGEPRAGIAMPPQGPQTKSSSKAASPSTAKSSPAPADGPATAERGPATPTRGQPPQLPPAVPAAAASAASPSAALPTQRQLITDAVTAIRKTPAPEAAAKPAGAPAAAAPPPMPAAMSPPKAQPAAASTPVQPVATSAPAPAPVTGAPAPAPTAPSVAPAWSVAPARVLAAPPVEAREGAAGPDATMAPYWGLRPGERAEPELPKPADMPRQAVPADQPPVLRSAEILAARPRPDTQGGEAPKGNVPDFTPPLRELAPASTPGATAEDPTGPDLETMQHLIQQLATQLNKPSARPPESPASPLPRPAVTADEAKIEQSVAALRTMADAMHKPAPDVFAGQPPALASAMAVAPAAVGQAMADETADVPSPYARLAVIAEAVAADRVELMLDPILALEDRKARHFEVSVHLRSDDGDVLETTGLDELIAGTGLLARIDAAKMTRTAAVADRLAQRGSQASLFANLQPESLADNGFLDSFADTFVDQQPLCARLVLSFSQADVRDFAELHWEAISTMAELGFRFALEHVTDLDMDFEMLKDNGFAFVKLDASVFLEGMQSGDEMVPSADICRHMAELGLGLIVGGIADEIDLAKIIGFGVVLGQGALFGAPRTVAVDVKPRAAA